MLAGRSAELQQPCYERLQNQVYMSFVQMIGRYEERKMVQSTIYARRVCE
uniref:Uncharacterized protein n=1 Tax=Ciona intestinalis TaxID=7719 RepID=H2Y0X0_CIOIN